MVLGDTQVVPYSGAFVTHYVVWAPSLSLKCCGAQLRDSNR